MQVKLALFTFGKEMFQAETYRAEGDFIPGDFGFAKEPDFQAFDAGTEIEVEQPGAEQQVYLIDIGQAIHRIQLADFDARVGFFECLANRRLCRAFAILHKAAGQGPQAEARLDSAAAQQYFVFPFGERTYHHVGVLVMDRAAGGADVPGATVVIRDAQRYGGSTCGTEFHFQNCHQEGLLKSESLDTAAAELFARTRRASSRSSVIPIAS